MDPWTDETSAISESPVGWQPKSPRRERLLGCNTLSSLAFPRSELGSSCSRSILNRVDRLGISKLVRKSSVDGSAMDTSSSGRGAGSGFLFFFHLLAPDFFGAGDGRGGCESALSASSFETGPSMAFFFKSLFIVVLKKSAELLELYVCVHHAAPSMEGSQQCAKVLLTKRVWLSFGGGV